MIPKFRIWDKKQNKMFDVEEIKIVYDELLEYTETVIYYNNNKRLKALVLDDCENEVMQSTGMFDKNGKEIYEGDVVEITRIEGIYDYYGVFHEYNYKGVVKQFKSCWVIHTGDNTFYLWSELYEYKIIGHKYMEDYKEFLNEK